jgi:hypothetical protein
MRIAERCVALFFSSGKLGLTFYEEQNIRLVKAVCHPCVKDLLEVCDNSQNASAILGITLLRYASTENDVSSASAPTFDLNSDV